MSESFLPPATAAMVNALSLRGFATVLALRGRSVTFRYWDESAGAMATRPAQTVLVTFDAERATEAEGETAAAAWSAGLIEKEGTLTVAPGDTFFLDGFAVHVTQVLPPEGGIGRARFALGAGVGGAG
jgi:hypothetical protein